MDEIKLIFQKIEMFNLSQCARFRLCCCKCRNISYKSVYNVEKLYPNPSLAYSNNPSNTQSDPEVFSGDIPKNKMKFTYSKSEGPGGQHVNKRLTKVEMRFHLSSAAWLPNNTRDKMLKKFGSRLTKNGELIVTSQKSRYLLNNEQDCFEKVREMIKEAEIPVITKEERLAELINMDSIQEAHKRRLKRKRMDSYTRSMRQDVYD